jgi:hypothetical protein
LVGVRRLERATNDQGEAPVACHIFVSRLGYLCQGLSEAKVIIAIVSDAKTVTGLSQSGAMK